MHHPRPFQVIEPSQWFWRGIHIHRWMSSEGYHRQLSWDRFCSWSILMTYWGDSLVYRQIQWVSIPKSAPLFGSALNDRFSKQHSCKSCNGISWKWWKVESILFLPSYHLTRSTMNQPRLHKIEIGLSTTKPWQLYTIIKDNSGLCNGQTIDQIYASTGHIHERSWRSTT